MELIIGTTLLCISIIAAIYTWKTYNESKKIWVSKVPATLLIKEIILFTGTILHQKGVRHYPTFRISNYKHKKFKGYYRDSKIVIYTYNNNDIPELIETTLHEICHHIQFRSKLYQGWKPYEYYNKLWGNYNNPYETEAREFAHEWIEPCIKHLEEKKVIVRK